MHDNVAQKAAEFFNFRGFFTVGRGKGPGHLAKNGVKIEADGYDDGHEGQGVQKGGKRGADNTECQGQPVFFSDGDKQPGKNDKNHVFQIVDARHHKDEQKQSGQVGGHFLVHGVGRGHADDDGLQGQQTACGNGVALQRQRKNKDKLEQQQPARYKGADHNIEDRVGHQKGQHRIFVPEWRFAKKAAEKNMLHSRLPAPLRSKWKENRDILAV